MMSEQAQTPQNENIPPEQLPQDNEPSFKERAIEYIQNRVELGRQLGSELKERAEFFVGKTIESSQVAYHGLASAVAEKRMERSGSTMERMDHKHALYYDIGKRALGAIDIEPASTVSNEPAKPRTWLERRGSTYLDKKIDKRNFKKSKADTYSWRAEQIHGKRNDLSGTARREKRQEVFKTKIQGWSGEITAREARLRQSEINATSPKIGEHQHKRVGKDNKKITEKLDRSTSMKYSSR